MSTLDKPKRNGTRRAGASVTTYVAPSVFNIDLSALNRIPPSPRVKKGCGQRKNKRDRAGRARHAETCRILQRYPQSNPEVIREQLRTGQLPG